MNTHTKTKITPMTIIKIYKVMKRNPKRIFKTSDFKKWFGYSNEYTRRVLKLLVRIDVAEIQPAIYKFGPGLQASRTVDGYRLIPREETKNV